MTRRFVGLFDVSLKLHIWTLETLWVIEISIFYAGVNRLEFWITLLWWPSGSTHLRPKWLHLSHPWQRVDQPRSCSELCKARIISAHAGSNKIDWIAYLLLIICTDTLILCTTKLLISSRTSYPLDQLLYTHQLAWTSHKPTRGWTGSSSEFVALLRT